MKTCYHHTSFDTLKKIITNNGLTFRASRYSNYENKEYTWIKDKAYKVVKEICQEQAQPFDNDLMEFNPYIICIYNRLLINILQTISQKYGCGP